jgi:hypothetical protein
MHTVEMRRARALDETGCKRAQGKANIENATSPANFITAIPTSYSKIVRYWQTALKGMT